MSIRDERRMMKSDDAARWLDGEVRDCGSYVVVTRWGRAWTVGKKFPEWERRVTELLA
jgi:hypothetical protein